MDALTPEQHLKLTENVAKKYLEQISNLTLENAELWVRLEAELSKNATAAASASESSDSEEA